MLLNICIEELGDEADQAKNHKGFVPTPIDFENASPISHALKGKCDQGMRKGKKQCNKKSA